MVLYKLDMLKSYMLCIHELTAFQHMCVNKQFVFSFIFIQQTWSVKLCVETNLYIG